VGDERVSKTAADHVALRGAAAGIDVRIRMILQWFWGEAVEAKSRGNRSLSRDLQFHACHESLRHEAMHNPTFSSILMVYIAELIDGGLLFFLIFSQSHEIMDSSTTSNPIAPSLAESASSGYDAESNLNLREMLTWVANCYSERELDGAEKTSFWDRYDQISEWREWYIGKYPHTAPERLAEEHGKIVDIRVLFMAYPIPAYSILLFLEACYEVDKAICGLDTIALASIKRWHLPQDMTAYKYLLSDEMVLWWKAELCELNNEIHSRASNRVSAPFGYEASAMPWRS
jgi:hypothetical protein